MIIKFSFSSRPQSGVDQVSGHLTILFSAKNFMASAWDNSLFYLGNVYIYGGWLMGHTTDIMATMLFLYLWLCGLIVWNMEARNGKRCGFILGYVHP